ncbi:hypothetical protein HFX_2378 [Haloferax mediterranei ATCC 33500]|uniref:Uncharacterized protein n=1 Tax=Haloferax mediterranei (strain ATCC 33500 / DSM 1411 / JCM 8866 / NBRC 14739 / NCIMB 2177 / R-4) TaxID=523841 RepID=I3R753_HALMT|nr:hypothetical protein HFX_2378 [Haloferax mediterranei ATCC 33500]
MTDIVGESLETNRYERAGNCRSERHSPQWLDSALSSTRRTTIHITVHDDAEI